MATRVYRKRESMLVRVPGLVGKRGAQQTHEQKAARAAIEIMASGKKRFPEN